MKSIPISTDIDCPDLDAHIETDFECIANHVASIIDYINFGNPDSLETAITEAKCIYDDIPKKYRPQLDS